MDQVSARLKQVSALLTLLLGVLFSGPLSAEDTLLKRSAAQALVELDPAGSAASLNGKHSARGSDNQEADPDGDAGDPALLPAAPSAAMLPSARQLAPRSAVEATRTTRRTNQARAPPGQ